MTKRADALLTKKQRAYLQMTAAEREEEFTRRERYQYRQRIKRRVENGMADMRLLHEFRALPTDDFADAFSPAMTAGEEEVEGMEAEIDARAYIPAAIRLLARALDANDVPVHSPDDCMVAYGDLLKTVEDAIERDLASVKETPLSVEVSLTPSEDVSLERLQEEELSRREQLRLVSLLQRGGVEEDRLAEAAPEFFESDNEKRGDNVAGDSEDDADE
jgi:hypothetical protein